MWWLLACIPPFPDPPDRPAEGDTDADTDADADADTDTDTDADSDTDVDTQASHSDDFASDSGLWLNIADVDGIYDRASWNVGSSQYGWAELVPQASAWYDDDRGPLRLKVLHGDFVATTHAVVTSAHYPPNEPGPLYSYGGLMARAKHDADGEDFVLVSVGTGSDNTPPRFVTETKNTYHGSTDTPREAATDDGEAWLAIARLDALLVMLVSDDGTSWTVQQKECRVDLPDYLQVGMIAVSDFNACAAVGADYYDTTTPIPGNPDVDARFDFVHFAAPIGAVADPCTTWGAGDDEDLLLFLAPWLAP